MFPVYSVYACTIIVRTWPLPSIYALYVLFAYCVISYKLQHYEPSDSSEPSLMNIFELTRRYGQFNSQVGWMLVLDESDGCWSVECGSIRGVRIRGARNRKMCIG